MYTDPTRHPSSSRCCILLKYGSLRTLKYRCLPRSFKRRIDSSLPLLQLYRAMPLVFRLLFLQTRSITITIIIILFIAPIRLEINSNL